MKFRIYPKSNITYINSGETNTESYYWIKKDNFSSGHYSSIWIFEKSSRESLGDNMMAFKMCYPNYKELKLICHPILRKYLEEL